MSLKLKNLAVGCTYNQSPKLRRSCRVNKTGTMDPECVYSAPTGHCRLVSVPKSRKPAKPASRKPAKPASGKYAVKFTVKFVKADEALKAPRKAELVQFVSGNRAIIENPTAMKYYDLSIDATPAVYQGGMDFTFTATAPSAKALREAFMQQSLSDTEYEAEPGPNTFVVPARDGSELGRIAFKSMKINRLL